jgi:hypothetical protein
VQLDARDGKKRKTAPAKCGLEHDSGGVVMVYDRLRRGEKRVNRLEAKARGYVESDK